MLLLSKKKDKRKESDIELLNLRKKSTKFNKFMRIVIGRTIPQKMFRIYLLAILLGAILLYIPISLKNNYTIYMDPLNPDKVRTYYFWDALFIACSAFSDTGLTPADISDSFTFFGQFIILVLIQIGGIGLMSLVFLIWNLFRKWNNIDINQSILLIAERGDQKMFNSFRMIRKAILFIFAVELFFAIFYSLWFCFMPAYVQQYDPVWQSASPTYDTNVPLDVYHDAKKSIWSGIFISISAINNAGFDVFNGTYSMASYRNDWNIIFQLMIITQIIIGGIGYPVIFDIFEQKKQKRKNIKYRVSLFTKVAVTSYFFVGFVGIIMAIFFESANNSIYHATNFWFTNDNLHKEFGQVPYLNKIFTIIFNVISTRSAGFSTIDHNLFSNGTKWNNIIQMYIGCSPSSTGGGIRTTTFMVIIFVIWNTIRGRKSVVLFGRTVSKKTAIDSCIVCISSIILLLLFTILMSYTLSYAGDEWTKFGTIDIFYECTSAFGTVGLSLGITSSIKPFGQILLIILMFIGQLGVSFTLLSWCPKKTLSDNVYVVEEEIKIG